MVEVSGPGPDAAPAVLRAGRVLALLEKSDGQTLAELSRQAGLAKSSVLKICRALEFIGLVSRDGERYRLGYRLAELGMAYLSKQDAVRSFHEVLRGHQEWRQTFQLAGLTEDWRHVVHLAKRDGLEPVHLASDLGQRLPSTCAASGKALLASLPLAEVRNSLRGHHLPQMTKRSIRSAEGLIRQLEEVRATGWAVDDEETAMGLLCVASALPPNAVTNGRLAVSLTVLKSQVQATAIASLGRVVASLATEIAQHLGPSTP